MSIPLPNKPWNKGDTFTNPETSVEYVYDGVKWLSTGGDFSGGGSEGGIHWEEIDTGSNQNPILTLRSTGARPTGSATEGVLTLWHLDPADCTTTPEQELKVWMRDGGQSIIDKWNDDGVGFWFEIRQGSKSQKMKLVGYPWVTNTTTFHCSFEDVQGDVLEDNKECQIFIRYDVTEDELTALDERYVLKKSVTGDHMMGPLNIQTATGTGSRETRRINTLGVFSNSDNSSLQLGTNVTKVYVGNNDTSFNGPIKVGEITDRGSNIKISAPLQFAQHDELMQINTNNGNTQNINVFKGSNSDFTTLKVNINGATWKNAIEFESGPSQGKETILRLDSNKGLKARNLNMDDTQITKLADPVNPTDAVNLQTVDGKVDNLAESLRDRLDTLVTDNSAGEMKFGIFMEPTSNGQFTCMTLNGASSTYDPLQTKEIWAHNKNLGGYDFNWSDVKPNSYFFMSGPGEALARFRVVADPIDQGTWTKIKVADAEVYPDGQQWVVNDVWDVLFRSFTGVSTDLDDYVKKSGDTMTGTLVAPRVNVKKDAEAVLLVEGNQSAPANAAARITMSNAYNSNAYGRLEWHGTTGSNGWFQFDKDVDLSSKGLHSVDHIRFSGSNKTLTEGTTVRVTFDGRTIVAKGTGTDTAGFELRGKTDEGSNNRLLQVYHNASGIDAVNYYGKQEGDNNILTVGGAKEMFQAIDLDEEQGPLGQLAPHGPMNAIGNVTRAPNAGEMTFDNYEMRLTTVIKMHKTDKTGETHEYKYNEDSILTLNFTDTVDGNDVSWNTSVRVDGITDRGSYIELVVDPRDAWVRSETGLFNPSMQFWYYNNGAVVTPMGRQIASYDDLFELRDEAGRLASLLTYKVSTNAVPFLGGAPGTMYFEGSINNPTTIKLSNRDAYFAGIDVNKNNTSSTMNIPGNIVIYDQADTNRAAVPVMIWSFASLRSDGTKKTVQLNSPTKVYQHASVPVDTSTFYRVEVNFTPGVTSTASPLTHTMMGKGMWGRALDDLSTDHFVGIDYYGNTRNALDNYTMGIAVAGRYGNEFTEGLEWKEGAFLEVFDSEGRLLFAKEIDAIEHDEKGYMRLLWEWQPSMYVYEANHKYGDNLMLKITGLTGDVRPSREASVSE